MSSFTPLHIFSRYTLCLWILPCPFPSLTTSAFNLPFSRVSLKVISSLKSSLISRLGSPSPSPLFPQHHYSNCLFYRFIFQRDWVSSAGAMSNSSWTRTASTHLAQNSKWRKEQITKYLTQPGKGLRNLSKTGKFPPGQE